jgi:hypothetical protein
MPARCLSIFCRLKLEAPCYVLPLTLRPSNSLNRGVAHSVFFARLSSVKKVVKRSSLGDCEISIASLKDDTIVSVAFR